MLMSKDVILIVNDFLSIKQRKLLFSAFLDVLLLYSYLRNTYLFGLLPSMSKDSFTKKYREKDKNRGPIRIVPRTYAL